MNIKANLDEVRSALPDNVTLVAVSKKKTTSEILEAYNAGQRVFGENRVQELVEKHETLPKDIHWHLIGHLQTNKVKYIAPFVKLIHSVDSYKLLKEINKYGIKNNTPIDCLLQLKIAKEESKFGLSITELRSILDNKEVERMKGLRIVGLMGMSTLTENTDQINEEFGLLYTMFSELSVLYSTLTILSMGMSGDYKIAIENGSNMVRVGSGIFGKRNYNQKT